MLGQAASSRSARILSCGMRMSNKVEGPELLACPCVRRVRREALARGQAHTAAGNAAAAVECYQRAVSITPRMAKVVVEVRDVHLPP